MQIDSVSVVIPFYNEELGISYVISELLAVIEKMGIDYELILVDDGSTDLSLEIVKKWQQKESRIHVVKHSVNKGLGEAFKTGVYASTKKYVFYTDSDRPFDFNLIPNLIGEIDKDHLLIGHRNERQDGLLKMIHSRGYNVLLSVLFCVCLKDVNFAFKFFDRRILKDINLRSTGCFIDAEFVLKTLFSGCAVKSIPITYLERKYGASHLFNFSNILRICYDMMRLYPELIKLRLKRFWFHIKYIGKVCASL